jgi:hypothetical protein
MNRNDFINMIEDKIEVNRQMMGEVFELINIFPYFQSAHMLLLKGLQNNADVKFENQLRNSAIHIADREVLYYLLREKPTVRNVGEETPADAKKPDEGNAFDHQQTVIESARNSDQLITEYEKDSDMSAKEPSDDLLQLHSHSILISSEADTHESEEVMMVSDEEQAQDEDKVFYMDPGFSVPDNNDLLELDTTEENVTITGENAIPGEPHPDAPTGKKLSQSELIDKFILENPRIEPVKSSSKATAEDISRSFTEREGEFVTEVLAKIYINQGYYSKAIDIYEKLSLKFPEKSSYFASQIELVKVYLKK